MRRHEAGGGVTAASSGGSSRLGTRVVLVAVGRRLAWARLVSRQDDVLVHSGPFLAQAAPSGPKGRVPPSHSDDERRPKHRVRAGEASARHTLRWTCLDRRLRSRRAEGPRAQTEGMTRDEPRHHDSRPQIGPLRAATGRNREIERLPTICRRSSRVHLRWGRRGAIRVGVRAVRAPRARCG